MYWEKVTKNTTHNSRVPLRDENFWGCVCFQDVGTFTDVQGNINAQKYLQIFDDNIWPASYCTAFPKKDCILMYDKAPVHRAKS